MPPLSQARDCKPRPKHHPLAGLADTAGPSGHVGTAELSFGDCTAGISCMAADVRQSGAEVSQQDHDLGAVAGQGVRYRMLNCKVVHKQRLTLRSQQQKAASKHHSLRQLLPLLLRQPVLQLCFPLGRD